MYQTHNSSWPIAVACLFCLLAIIMMIRQKRKKPGDSNWLTAIILVFISCTGISIGIKAYDHYRQRQELGAIVPSEVSRLVLTRGNLTREIAEAPAIISFLSQIKCIQWVKGHHTGPVDNFDVSFQYRGHEFHYKIGRDRIRTNEYWVQGGGGRFYSDDFGAMVEKLLRNQPPKKD